MKNLILLILINFIISDQCYSQNWSWIGTDGHSDNESVKYVSVDSSGNSYIIGVFSQPMFYPPNRITSRGGDDFFIASYDPNGNLKWAKSGGGVADDGWSMYSITDSLGNTTVALSSIGQVQYDSVTLYNQQYDINLLKYDSTGNLLFAKSYGGASTDIASGGALDSLGNFYLTGFYMNTIVFGSTILVSNGQTDFYLAKFDNTGNVIWAKNGGGISYDGGTGIAIDKYNHVYVTGYFSDVADFIAATL